jgi:hypothetical protein
MRVSAGKSFFVKKKQPIPIRLTNQDFPGQVGQLEFKPEKKHFWGYNKQILVFLHFLHAFSDRLSSHSK